SIRTGIVAIDSNLPNATGPVVRPSAVKSNDGADTSSDQPTYKPAVQKNISQVPAAADSGSPVSADDAPKATDSAASSGSYYVQVAAVSKQEDADALVEALKKKQYSA